MHARPAPRSTPQHARHNSFVHNNLNLCALRCYPIGWSRLGVRESPALSLDSNGSGRKRGLILRNLFALCLLGTLSLFLDKV